MFIPACIWYFHMLCQCYGDGLRNGLRYPHRDWILVRCEINSSSTSPKKYLNQVSCFSSDEYLPRPLETNLA